MDHRAWLWKKKSSEKTIFATNKVDHKLHRTEEVLKSPVGNGVRAEKLASDIDCSVELDIASMNDEETVADVILSQEKEKEENTMIPKQKLDENSNRSSDELSIVREAVMAASIEYEKANNILEEKHAEAVKQVAILSAENANMSNALIVKERLVEDLTRKKSQAEAEFGELMTRLDSTEKENSFLKYEFCTIERELRIRTEEMEFYRRSDSLSQKKQSESSEKIAKLEQECQRLRALTRKRSNGPSYSNQPKGIIRNQTEPRRRNSNGSSDMVVRDSATIERLRVVEEENEALKRVLNRKIFDTGSEDAVSSSSGSWTQFEHHKNTKREDRLDRKASEISLMDDFVEMERLAIVSVDKPSERANGKPFDWLQVVLSAMSDQKHISKRSLAELLEDIRIALGFVNPESNKAAKLLSPKEADPVPISGYLTWNSPKGSHIMNSSSEASSLNTSPKEKGNGISQSSLRESAGKIIKLIRDVNPNSQKLSSPTSVDYFIRVFQWKNSELSSVLKRFVQTCDDLSSGRGNLERFAEEVAISLDWILNNYVTPKEAASARDKIKKHFGWNEIEPEREDNTGSVQSDENSQCALREENRRLNDELKSVVSEKSEIESRLKLAIEKGEGLVIHLKESQQRVGKLQAELDAFENDKLASEDLDTQLSIAKAKLNEVLQRVSSLEIELEDKRNCCEELEATCLELQLQLESDVAKETPKHKSGQEEKKSQSGWEITAASAKLAECQETIVSLGKQLKALATPKEAAILDKVFSETIPNKEIKEKDLKKRSSLRDRMMAEDGSQRIREHAISRSDGQDSFDAPVVERCQSLRCNSRGVGSNVSVALAIVPSRKKGGGFDLLKKLLVKKRRSNSQKSTRYSTNE